MKNGFWEMKSAGDEKEQLELKTDLSNLKRTFYIEVICLFCPIPSIIIMPILEGNSLPFPCYRPNWIPVKYLAIYQGLIAPQTVLSLLGSDMLFLGLVKLTQIQFKLLNQEMKTIFDEINDDDFEEVTKRRLSRCIRHHLFLLDFGKRIGNIFSVGIFVYVVVLVLHMCVEMYLSSVLTSPFMYIQSIFISMAGVYIFGFVYCIPAHSLVDEAEKVSYSIFSSKWYEHPKYAKEIMMIMIGSKTNLTIKACGILNIDLVTCLSTVKTMVSYSMFLRTMASQE
ncbi:hypothetical protein JTB14_008628 [Gonioctena quinquepunctata]|nr:hypothetical protein JTB14_008628 [Gonioctena quinquepunctata]